MTDTKHTPGPWRLMRGQVFGYPEALSMPVLSFSLPEEERLSNARLIAAAPDLLEALKECLGIVRLQNGNLHDDINTIQEKADAAIAKAEGRDNG